MSLLLDALRRAAAAKQGPAGDRYTMPRRGDAGPAPVGPPVTGDEGDTPTAPAGGDEGGELELELREDGGEPAQGPGDRAGAVTPAAHGDTATARAVLHGGHHRAGERVRGVLVLGAGVLVLAAAFAAGTWYYYRLVYTDVTRELASFRPQSAPAPAPAEGTGNAAGAGGTAADRGDAGGRMPATDTATGAPRPGASAAPGETTVASADTAAAGTAADAGEDTTATAGDADSPAQQSDGAGTASARATDRGDAGAGGDGDSAGAPAPSPAEEAAAPRASKPAAGETPPTREAREPAPQPRRAQPMVQASAGQPLMEALQAGYEALQGGDLAAAAAAYRRARRLAPDNRDALLGAAAVAQRRGEAAEARALYERILGDYPRDPYARAGLLSLDGAHDPRRSESELKMMLRERPEAASLHFALGNVYAAEARWADAQEAYFEAARAAPGDAAYAYNLAVALDHLGQRAAARRHYERALRLADGRTTGVPVDAVQRRLRQLR